MACLDVDTRCPRCPGTSAGLLTRALRGCMMFGGKRRAGLLSACTSTGDGTVEISRKPGAPAAPAAPAAHGAPAAQGAHGAHGAHDGSIGDMEATLQDLEAGIGPLSRRLVPLLVELGNAYGDAG